MATIFLDENVYRYSKDVLNRIVIGSVTGVLREPLQFTVEANWENIFSFNDRFESLKKILSTVNVGGLNAGIWTRKYYKGGSYLKIDPKFRVVDWDGTGNVIRDAEKLTNLALPNFKGGSVTQQINEAKKNISVQNSLQVATETLTEGANVLFNPNETLDRVGAILSKEIFTNSPEPVWVDISNFFRHKFVVESVQVQFSKEMTEFGPLYADFDVSLSTFEVATKGQTGLRKVTTRFETR